MRGAMIDLVIVGVHDGKRVDVVALALCLGADALALGDRGGAFGEILRRRRHVGIQQQAQRDAPIGDAACGIGLEHIFEYMLRRAVPERMLIQHRAIEELLRFRRARGFEMHLAELVVVRLREGRLGQRNARQAPTAANATDIFHDGYLSGGSKGRRGSRHRSVCNADFRRVRAPFPEVISEKQDFYRWPVISLK